MFSQVHNVPLQYFYVAPNNANYHNIILTRQKKKNSNIKVIPSKKKGKYK